MPLINSPPVVVAVVAVVVEVVKVVVAEAAALLRMALLLSKSNAMGENQIPPCAPSIPSSFDALLPLAAQGAVSHLRARGLFTLGLANVVAGMLLGCNSCALGNSCLLFSRDGPQL